MVMMGIFWLLLAGALLLYQLTNPVTVKVNWETATELDTAGFFLYRSSSADGDFELINDTMIDSQGTAGVADAALEAAAREVFRLTPSGIIETLDLARPIYRQTAAYGHFGRSDIDLKWERTDRAVALKAALG